LLSLLLLPSHTFPLLQGGLSSGCSSLRKYLSCPRGSCPWAAVWVSAVAPKAPPPPHLAAHAAASHRFSVFPSAQVALFALSQVCFPRGTTTLAAGLSHAQWCVHWSRLEPAISSTGQPRLLLAEAVLQPPTASTWAPPPNTTLFPLLLS